ncbi:MAG TPA: cation transporter [Roseiarcus sp.]|nr:cation transporter [Roseiarcus sp.]
MRRQVAREVRRPFFAHLPDDDERIRAADGGQHPRVLLGKGPLVTEELCPARRDPLQYCVIALQHDHDKSKRIATKNGDVILDVFFESAPVLAASAVSVETVRPDGARQVFAFVDKGGFLESVEEIPEPHAFNANVKINGQTYPVVFEGHELAHSAAARDNNMRAAVVHVIADAAVSVLVIIGLILARAFGWLWMDPLAGIVGAFVIASWALGLSATPARSCST